VELKEFSPFGLSVREARCSNSRARSITALPPPPPDRVEFLPDLIEDDDLSGE